jgi:hypothetical protein
LTEAFSKRFLNQFIWQKVLHSIYFPTILDLSVSVDEFWNFINKRLQESRNPVAKKFLQLLSSPSAGCTKITFARSLPTSRKLIDSIVKPELSGSKHIAPT